MHVRSRIRETRRRSAGSSVPDPYTAARLSLSLRTCAEALNWTRSVMTRIGLTLNDAKTSIKQARKERFDFLGYSFGPHRLRKNGHEYLGASPSKKSVSKLRQKVGDLLVRQNVAPWTEV